MQHAVDIQAHPATAALQRFDVYVGGITRNRGCEDLVERERCLRVAVASGCRRIELFQSVPNLAQRQHHGADALARLLANSFDQFFAVRTDRDRQDRTIVG